MVPLQCANDTLDVGNINKLLNAESLSTGQLYAHGAQDRNWFLSMIDTLRKGDPTDGYKRRLERHREHVSGNGAKT